MKGGHYNLFMLWLASCLAGGWAQRSPFSLQAAVDELHRQEYPLNAPPGQQPHFMAGAFGSSPDQDYWDEEAAYTRNTKKHRNRLNKQLAKYLERDSYDADHGGLGLGPFGGYEFDEDSNRLSLPPYTDERKRSSIFRERSNNVLYDDGPQSIFRENELQDGPERSELTEQFLREIERSKQDHERYKDFIRNVWDKYQQQPENELDTGNEMYEEQKKRMRMPPYYMLMQRKRSYPVLPWLPYSADRKKRFPVAKRSTSHVSNEAALSSLGKTDENVERELSELFGTDDDDKKKRSVEEKRSNVPTTHNPDAADTAVSEATGEENKNTSSGEVAKSSAAGTAMPPSEEHHAHAGHSGGERKRKRSNHGASHESREEEGEEEDEDSDEEHDSEEEEEDHDHEHDHEHDREHDHEHEHERDDEEEDSKRKKKRDASAKRKRNISALKRTLDDYNIMRSKKSIDWSKYFGLNRKKKAMIVEEDDKDGDKKKRDAEEDAGTAVDEDEDKKKKRNLDPAKLENMNKKLQAIEDFIINETIKYTGAHEGIGDPNEIQRLKDRVLSRLATAYSLEKMRRALGKLRQSVENENHLMHNVIEPDSSSESSENTSLEAVKKDDRDDNDDDRKRKMKKSNGFMRYPDVPNEFGEFEDTLQSPPNRYETLNDAYLGNKNYIMGSNQCPIIESMAERCRGVDLLSGDLNQELLPLCGVHQLCYLCGTSQVACDYQYLAEADALCGPNNNDCQATARSVLMILRGTPGPQLGPRECVKNSCLYSAMREIGL